MHLTRRQMMNLEARVKPGRWPMKESPHTRAVVRPNLAALRSLKRRGHRADRPRG